MLCPKFKYKIKRGTLGGGRGISLIEVIVSVALLAILSLMVVSAMTVSLAAIKTTRQRTNSAMNAASQVESQRAAGSAGSTDADIPMTITFDSGGSYTVYGSYVYGGTSGSVTYKEFVPD